MAIVIRMPEVLAGTEQAVIANWLVRPGEDISVGQPIAEIETDKAVVEYAAEVAGTLAGTLGDVGAVIPVGSPIAVLAEGDESAAAALQASNMSPDQQPDVEAPRPSDGQAPSSAAEPDDALPARPARLFASPLVRWIASQRGIDLSGVKGTGPDGRIVRRDIDRLGTAASAPPPAPVPERNGGPTSVAGSGAVPVSERAAAPESPKAPAAVDVPHSGMRRAIARRLTESKSTIPHFYMKADCRVDELLDLRRKLNEQSAVRISVNDLIVKAVGAAFREVPEANAIWTDQAVRRFHDVDVAVAVSVADGLLTPVVKAVDKLSVAQLSTQIRDLSGRAREGKIRQDEIDGGSFTVSNLGMHGTSEFAAIINPPHCGILAVGAAQQRPVVTDGQLAVATVVTVTLSADHRVLDGAMAATWLAAFVRVVENPLTILL